MSKRSELKENILASKLEVFLAWALENRNTVLTVVGIAIVTVLISSVFFIRNKEKKELDHTRLAQVQFLIIQGHYPQANQILDELKASGLAPAFSAMVSYFQGLSALGTREFDKAAQAFQEAIDKGGTSPLRPLALSNLGFALEQKRDFEGASSVYGRFMTDHGDHFLAPRIQLLLGQTLAFTGKTEESKKALEQLIDLYPTSVWAENARSFMDKNKTR